MGKKRGRRGSATRSTQEKLVIRRGKRNHFIIISVLTALASLALVVAGFLSYSPPSTAPSTTPTVVAPANSQGAMSLPIGLVIADGFGR